jgi:PAS domain S-box-containing protein
MTHSTERLDLFETGPFGFLGKIGPTSSLIKNFDWSATTLGAIATWPGYLKSAVSMMLQSPVPMTILWGSDGVLIYNDGYARIAGAKHPEILGMTVRDAWPENAAFNAHVMQVGLSGASLTYQGQEITLQRGGPPEQVWLDLFYSPILDATDRPTGVLAVVIETTQRVLADRRIATEHHRLQTLFEQSPTFMAMLAGPTHTLEMLNPEFSSLVGARDVIGQPLASALPEIVEQGLLPVLNRVLETGDPETQRSAKVVFQSVENNPDERYLDVVFQPIRDNGADVTHIFVQGSDVTERVRGERQQKLLIAELNHRVKNSLASVQSIVAQTLRATPSITHARTAITSRIMALSRAHDVLTDERWTGVDLRVITEAMLQPFEQQARGRLEISGPKVRLTTRAALSLSFALNELATNAATHGSLSNDAGVVQLSWRVSGGDNGVNLDLSWRESGGPEPVLPSTAGFGNRVILRAMPLELGGKASATYDTPGLAFNLTLPLANIEEKP